MEDCLFVTSKIKDGQHRLRHTLNQQASRTYRGGRQEEEEEAEVMVLVSEEEEDDEEEAGFSFFFLFPLKFAC